MMKKRVLAMLLALTMMFSLLPVNTFAGEEALSTKLEEQLSDVQESVSSELVENVEIIEEAVEEAAEPTVVEEAVEESVAETGDQSPEAVPVETDGVDAASPDEGWNAQQLFDELKALLDAEVVDEEALKAFLEELSHDQLLALYELIKAEPFDAGEVVRAFLTEKLGVTFEEAPSAELEESSVTDEEVTEEEEEELTEEEKEEPSEGDEEETIEGEEKELPEGDEEEVTEEEKEELPEGDEEELTEGDEEELSEEGEELETSEGTDGELTDEEQSMDSEALPEEQLKKVAAAPKKLFGAGNSSPFNLNDNHDRISLVKITHRHEGESEWLPIDSDTVLDGNEELHVKIFYDNITALEIKNSGYQMTYYPGSYINSVEMSGPIISGGVTIGSITVAADGSATVSFTPEWIEDQIEYDPETGEPTKSDKISGDFEMTAHFDLSAVHDADPDDIKIGDVPVTVKEPQNIIAEYGEVHVDKPDPTLHTVEESDGTFSHYLDYVVTVTAGKDGCPGVYVEDFYTQNGDKVESVDYANAVESSSVGGSAGTVTYDDTTDVMTWNIGTMAPYETRTLSYSVKMQPGYVGNKTTENVRNHVDLFAETYKRDEDDADYNGRANVNVLKTSSDVTEDESGNMYIDYTVVATAASNNPYELTNVHLTDNFANRTQDKFEPYIHYDSPISVTLPGQDPHTEPQPAADAKSFAVTIPVLKPGEAVTVTYRMKVDADVASQANEDLSINNRAEAWDDSGEQITDGDSYNYRDKDTTLESKRWARKGGGSKTTSAQTIPVSGELYDATGGSIVKMSATSDSFDVPRDSFYYELVVNETGDWDIKDLNMTDTLSATNGVNYLAYKGYVKAEIYDMPEDVKIGTDAYNEIAANGALVKTVWVKVDGLTSFSYTAEQIGLAESGDTTYALRMSYYAAPQNAQNVVRVEAGNAFSVSGQVIGPNGTPVALNNIDQNLSVTVTGGKSYQITKESWYYDMNGTPDYPNGFIYWAIKIDTPTLQQGLVIQESANIGSTGHNLPRNEAVVGFYRMALGGQRVNEAFSSLDELKAYATEVDISEYCNLEYSQNNNKDMNFRFIKTMEMEGEESLYIILRSTPVSTLPDRNPHTFTNKLNLSYNNGGSWDSVHPQDTITVPAGEGIVKETGIYFIQKANGTMEIPSGQSTTAYNEYRLGKDYLTANGMSGVFTSWTVKLNFKGVLGGDGYVVVDNFPQGLEPVYARLKWYGGNYTSSSHPRLVQIPDSGWEEHSITYNTDNNTTETSWYYTNGQQLMFQVDGFLANGATDSASIDVQVLARVVDNDVLASGASKTFRNTADLSRNGTPLDFAASPINVHVPSIRKDGVYPEGNGGKFPFSLVMNQGADDLVPNSDVITVVDEMNGSLTLLTESIKVVNNANNTVLPESSYVVSVETQTVDNQKKTILKVTIPDSMAVTISYDCLINATPDQPVDISNTSHWEGQAADPTSSVNISQFKYSAAGQAFSEKMPHIKMTKVDGSNTGIKLDGAKFEIAPVIMDPSAPNGYRIDPNNHHFHITGDDGDETGTILCYNLSGDHSESGSNQYQYNTVYAIREVEAPAGYILNNEWIYWMVLKPINDELPEVPAGVVPFINGYEFPMTAYNYKSSVIVEKAFDGAPVNGVYTFGIWKASDVGENGVPKRAMALEPVTINYPLTTQAEFYGLIPGETYYVYELDDTGMPVVPAAAAGSKNAVINGNDFIVSYPGASGAQVSIPANITTSDPKPSVTVQNHEKQYGQISLQKSFPQGVHPGYYYFELVSVNASDEEERVGQIRAVYLSDDVSEVKFEKLELDATYRVYELQKNSDGSFTRLQHGDIFVLDDGNYEVAYATTLTGSNEVALSDASRNKAISVENELLTQITVRKALTGEVVTGQTYHFGLSESQPDFSVPFKGTQVSITYTDGGVNAAVFPLLHFGHEYYVFELDDAGKPIAHNAQAVINSQKTTVTYSNYGAAVALTDVHDEVIVTATNNIHKPDPVEVTFSGLKEMSGRDLRANEFTFALSRGDEVLQTATNSQDGTYSFEPLPFTEAGEYTYTVSEVIPTGSTSGVTYDKRVYHLTVTVTNNGSGSLVAAISDGSTDGTDLNFVNSYTPAPVDVSLSGTKTLTGRPLADQEFSFTIYGETDGITDTVKNDANGLIDFGTHTFTAPGVYKYTVQEVLSNEPGVTQDTRIYNITVTVTDDGKGALDAIVTGVPTTSSLNFTNSYVAKSTSVTFSGSKTFTGFPEDATNVPQFTFNLIERKQSGEYLLDSQSVTGSGDFVFKPITFEDGDEGTYSYVIKEVKGNTAGVIYDEREYAVTVDVTDDAQGQLIATLSGATTDGSGLNFNNTYEPAPAQVTLTGHKSLSGRDLANEEFSFTLEASDGFTRTVKNTADGLIDFGTHSFDKAGVYTCTVKEEPTDELGVTIDSKVYHLTITVTDNGSGHLTAVVTDENSNPFSTSALNFTNKYEARSASVVFGGEKFFNGFPADSEVVPVFTFKLSEIENGLVKPVETKTVTHSGENNFTAITYKEPGVHKYVIEELAGDLSGVTYDTRKYNLTVTVTDDLQGHLVAAISGANTTGKNLDFTNSYKAEPVKLRLSGVKTLEGRDLVDGEFSFTLTGSDGTNLTVNNASDGTIDFGEREFKSAGVYTFTVKENDLGTPGVTFDSKIYNFTVTVTDDGKGQLKAALSGDIATGSDVNFKNTYTANSTSVTLSGYKSFNGFPKDSSIQPEFTFTLSEGGKVIGTKSVTMQGAYAFDSITYTSAGVHNYVIEEVAGNQSGVTYDTKKYNLTVTVTDDGSGQLHAAITGGSTIGTDLNFVNSYEAQPVSVSLSGLKTLTGEGLTLTDKQFSFTLKAKDEAFTYHATNDASGKIDFGTHEFTKPGEYHYVVTEDATDIAGVTIDSKEYNITVTVTDSGNGKLHAAISGGSKTGSDLNFNNTYKANSTSVVLEGKKTFTGFPEDSSIEPVFNFTLYEGDTLLDTQSVTKSGPYRFKAITYENTGTHTYVISETVGNQKGVVYDKESYEVTVTVTDVGGQLVAAISGGSTTGKNLDFENSYVPEPVSVPLSGWKKLEGRALKPGEFGFTLHGEQDGITVHAENDIHGKIDFGSHEYTKAGVYNYTITEDPTTEEGVTIDSKVYHVTVTVTDSGNGKLAAAISGDTATGDEVTVVNTYKPGSTSLVLGGKKTFNGFPEDSEISPEFTFTLYEGDVLLDTQSVTKHGEYHFKSITYTAPGEHTYTVSEVAGTQSGVTYDKKTYTVVVTVSDDGAGHLVTSVSGNTSTGTDLDFTNTYEPAPVAVSLSGLKTLVGEGKTLQADEFSFTITGGEDGITKTVTNDADGKIDFGKHEFTKVGVYEYTVREDPTDEEGVTIDSKVYHITVTVTDSGNGQLKAVISGDTTTGSNINFTNTYKPHSVSVVLGGTKTFTGLPADSEIEPEFAFALSEFVLSSADGTVIDTQTVRRHGDYDFVSLTYDRAGEYKYTVAETQGNQDGVTYDPKVYKVTVTVKDVGGHLEATVSGDSSTGTDLNFTNSYEAAPVDVHLLGHKTLNGKPLEAGEFSFLIQGEEEGLEATFSNAADGKIDFGKHTYSSAGVYHYTVHELNTQEEGVVYDSKIYHFTVTVTDDGRGQLKAAITGDTTTGTDLAFTNTYDPQGTFVILGGTKTFTGFPADSEIDPEFSFELSEFTLSEGGTVIDTQTVLRHGDYDFKTITYTKADIGDHHYTIAETKGNQSGVTYDTKVYEITVNVADVGGHLEATISGDSTTGTDLNFTNSYKAAPAEVHLTGMKTLEGEGKALTAGEFSFTITGGQDGASVTVSNDADGKIDFGKHQFTKAGVYEYTVREEPTEEAGVTIDSKIYKFTVTVTDSGNGQLEAAISGDIKTGSDVNFVNKYQANSTSVILGGKKTLNGFPSDSTIEPVFTFTLSEGGQVIDTQSVTKSGEYDFASITYTEAGTHIYVVAETKGNQSGVIYDENTYEVTVTVTDDGKGQLVAAIGGESEDGQNLNFTNSYEAAPAEVHLSGVKLLEGREDPLAEGEFSFTLTGEDGTSETVTNASDGKITFTKLTYTKAGEYNYTVKEDATDVKGVTIDSKIYRFTVTVSDSGNGRLAAAITGDIKTGNDVNFTNTYKAGSTSVILGGKKTFNGFPSDSTIEPVFTFTLSEGGQVIDTQSVTKSGDYDFKAITYTEVGTHNYVIAETRGNQAGVTYDAETYEVTVTVTDDGQGQLVAAISGESEDGQDLDFTNSYKAGPVDIHLTGAKTLKGRTLTADEYSFTITGGQDGATVTVTNNADGKIDFGKHTFTKPGVYSYIVKENATEEKGVTIDSKVYTFTVTVTDNGNGQLAAAITGDIKTGNDVNFTNTYKAGSTSVILGGKKTLNGFPSDSAIEPVFTFTLSEDGQVIDTQSVTKSGDYDFKAITYTEAGTHNYVIAETKGSQAGVTYDEETYEVTVTVVDDGHGQLVAAISGESEDGQDLDFTNGYKAKSVEVHLTGVKTLEGRALTADEFSFTITGGEDGITETVTNDADGRIDFGKHQFTKAGVYEYTVREDTTNEKGVTIDSKVYHFTVNVTDNGNGQLEAAITGDIKTGNDVNFTNTYKAGSTSVILGGKKTFNDFPSDSTIEPVFTFTLSEDGVVIDTQSVVKQGDYDFKAITYTEVGTHNYVIAESKGNQAGVTYDEETYEVTVNVTDDGHGQLIATISGESEDGQDLDFTNGYKAKPVAVHLSGVKTLIGRDLVADEFSFTVTGEEEGISDTVFNTADGKIDFGKHTYTKPGVYNYTVHENPTDEKGVTIDSRVYHFSVTVTDSGDGQLRAVIDGDTTTGTDVNFANTYKAGSTSVIFGGTKTFTGFPADSEITPEFSFELSEFTLSEGGSVIDTQKVYKHGDYDFKSITYTEPGTHTYVIAETKGHQAGVTYDAETYEVTVTVVDDGHGQLIATISGDSTTGTDLNFVNSYKAAPVDVHFTGMKTLEGRPLTEDEFSFTLTGEDGTFETVTNAANGKIAFSKLTYTEAGVYKYSVKEESTNEPGVTGDNKIYHLTVTVTDSGNGQLSASIDGDSTTGADLNFKNTYIPDSASVILGGRKSFRGFPAESDIVPEFTFTLSENGIVIDSETVQKDGEYEFAPIIYTEKGIHNYVIRETIGSQSGVTYDTRTYAITVTVKDVGGQLVAAVSGDSQTGTDLNFINDYSAAPVDVHFSGMKTLEGDKILEAEMFTFTLTNMDDNSVVETVSNSATGKISFNELHFTEVGEYHYTVKEDHKSIPGVTIDSKIYHLTVTVTDSGNGHLAASIDGDSTTGTDLNFVNTYLANSTSVILSGKKVLEGFPEDAELVPEFTFTLSEAGEVIDTATVQKNGEFDFNSITYTEEGTYTYKVAEVAGDHIGMRYDDVVYTVTVNVEDPDKKGQLVATVNVAPEVGEDLLFTNVYTAEPVEIHFSGMKTLEGRDLVADEFSFTLTGEDGTSETVTNAANGKISFSKITFSEAGIYTYVVSEEASDELAITTDKKIYNLTVTVTDSGNGHLTAAVSGDSSSGTDLNFTNTYVPQSTSVELGGTKTLIGFPAESEIVPVFTFTLSENGEVIDTQSVEKQGAYNFNAITYTEAGEHTYTVAETAGKQAGVTYDETTYEVTVTVTDNKEGKLIATIDGASSNGTDLNFTNTYKPQSTSIGFGGTKTFTGFPAVSEIVPVFTFTLSEDGEIIDTRSVEKQGAYNFDDITYTEAGEHTYTVAEAVGNQAGVTYDETTYEVTVLVTDDGSGQLVATIDGDSSSSTDLNFTNSYLATPVEVTLSGMKSLNGKPLLADEFSFTLSGNGTQETVTNAGNGSITFSKLTFTEPGVYTYSVKEEATDEAGITIDAKVYTVIVTVEDSGDGQLTAKISGDTLTGTDLNFNNIFKSGSLVISKTVTGELGDKNRSFTFTVTFEAPGSYPYFGSKRGMIRSGDSIPLKHGESIIIKGLPEKISYTVKESDNDGYRVYSTGDSGHIIADTELKASFTNTKSNVPQTGDNTNILLWFTLTVSFFLAWVATLLPGGRKKKRYGSEC